MKLDSARYVLVPIVTALSGALATVGAAYVTDAGFANARDAKLTPVENATVVQTLADPIYDGVEILKDVRIIDLRAGAGSTRKEDIRQDQFGHVGALHPHEEIERKELRRVRICDDRRGDRCALSHSQVRAHHDEAAPLPWQHAGKTCGAED